MDGVECGLVGIVVVGWVLELGGDGVIDVGNDVYSGCFIVKFILDYFWIGGYFES